MGVVVTVVAALVPAVRATRVPPIAALREGVTLPRGALRALLLGRIAGLFGIGRIG